MLPSPVRRVCVSGVGGEDDPHGPQLVDQACCLTWAGDLGGAAGRRLIAAEVDGDGGQVREDLVLANVGVLRPRGIGACGAGVAVAAPVSRRRSKRG
jgi:hypothetical protein